MTNEEMQNTTVKSEWGKAGKLAKEIITTFNGDPPTWSAGQRNEWLLNRLEEVLRQTLSDQRKEIVEEILNEITIARISGFMKAFYNDHGNMTLNLIPSASKRVTCGMKGIIKDKLNS